MAFISKIFNTGNVVNAALLLEKLISLVFPPKCLQCNKITSSSGTICAECWSNMEFITKPYCKTCGAPFEFDIERDLECGACTQRKPYFDSAFSLFKYNAYSQKIIHKLKYNDKLYLSKYLAQWLNNRLSPEEIRGFDYIIPVPLHKNRLRQRLYNQSALIARHFSHYSGITFLANALIKAKYKTPQTGLSRQARIENVKNSFALNIKAQPYISGSNVLLVDDVYTTGSTLNECSKVLKHHGCRNIKVITIART